MTSKKQLAANRKNALKSTGPKTAEGLVVVSQNALTHGFSSKQSVLLPHEDLQEYQALVTSLMEDFSTVTQAEKTLVEKMAQVLWKKKRLGWYENVLTQAQFQRKNLDVEKTLAFEAEQAGIPKLQEEIKVLEEGLVDLEGQIREATRINRLKQQTERFQEEAREWIETTHELLKELDTELDGFLNWAEREDSRKDKQKTPGGEYSATRWHCLCGFENAHQIEEEDETPAEQKAVVQILHTVGLKGYVETMRDWLPSRKEKLEILLQKQELEKQIQLAGYDLLLEETQLQRVQRYEVHLENQFYRALAEFQKLQVFLHQKQKSTGVKNGFVLMSEATEDPNNAA